MSNNQKALVPQPEPEATGDALARNLGLMRERADAYYQRGLQHYEMNDYGNAILDLSEAIHYDGGHAEYYSTRGLFYVVDGQADAAHVDLEYALKLSKRQWLAAYSLGILAFQDGDYQEALARFNQASPFALRRIEVWFYRAVTHHQLDDDKSAAADMHRAIQLMSADDKRRKDAQAWMKEFKNADKGTDKNTDKGAAQLADKSGDTKSLEAGGKPLLKP